MITRSSLKREIDEIRSIIANLAAYTEQHNEIHTDLDNKLDHLDNKIRDLDARITQLETSYGREMCEVNLQLDKIWNSISSLDSFTQQFDRELYLLESKIEFLDANKDAIEMWIECVRQTQQLYQESQKPVDNIVE